jgi:hypothetical protein
MKIKATHLCRCGHVASAHTVGVFDWRGKDESASLDEVQENSRGIHDCPMNCEKFELSNLDLIEYLAKKRGLI